MKWNRGHFWAFAGILALCAAFLPSHAQAAPPVKVSPAQFDALMQKGVDAYQQKNWKSALENFKLALRAGRKRPPAEKAPIQVYVGFVLAAQNHRGLAWKSFEQALYANPKSEPPPSADSSAVALFERVRSRVERRGGGKRISTSGGGLKISPLTWGLAGLAGVGIFSGVLFLLNSQASVTELDRWEAEASQKEPTQALTFRDATKASRSIASTQNTLAIVSFAVAGVAVAGAVVVLLVLKPSNASASVLPLSPLTPTAIPSHDWKVSFE